MEIYYVINETYAAASGEVQWRMQWSATPVDETESIAAPTHTGTIDFGDDNIPATAYYLTEVEATLSTTNIAVGDMVGITFDRIALDAGANPTADPVVVRIELHYTSDKLGEAL